MAVMGSIGLAIIYGFKVNISIAIVAMVNHTALKENSENYNATNEVKLDNSTANASEVNIKILFKYKSVTHIYIYICI